MHLIPFCLACFLPYKIKMHAMYLNIYSMLFTCFRWEIAACQLLESSGTVGHKGKQMMQEISKSCSGHTATSEV